MVTKEQVNELMNRAKAMRKHVIEMIGVGKTGHLGGSCSCADILAVLYFHKMIKDPKRPEYEGRDRFLLSKGHAALIQYAALAEAGYFPKDELKKVKSLGAMLQGHPDMKRTPGVEANTGSLGQGLSIGCGIALGLKLDKSSNKVYVLVGDGEAAEGQIWEAAMAASFYKLDNLRAILDRNKLQATGPIIERFNTNPVKQKWEAFGWHVAEIDGHDISQICDAFDKADEIKDKPVMIIANTIKGKGISFAENNASFHNGSMTQEQYLKALEELCKE
jgi:transketolase